MREMNEEQLEAASVTFAMAAQFVGAEPTCEWLASCKADDLFDGAPFGMEDESVAEGLNLMRSYVQGLDEVEIAEASAELGREWLRLFVGVGAPEAPVWESFYVETNSPMMSKATLEVRSLFQKYDMSLVRQGSEPDDALGPMLAFCSHVQHCEVAALQEGLQEKAGECCDDLDSFISQHLLPWIAAWSSLVEEHAVSGYFRGVGLFVFGLLRCYVKRFAIRWDEVQGRFVRVVGGAAEAAEHPVASRFDVEALSNMANKVSQAASLMEAAEIARVSKAANAAAMAALPGLAKGQTAGLLATKAAAASAQRVAQVAAEGALKVMARRVTEVVSSAVEAVEGAAEAETAKVAEGAKGAEAIEGVRDEQAASPSKGIDACAELGDELVPFSDFSCAEPDACGEDSDVKGKCFEKE